MKLNILAGLAVVAVSVSFGGCATIVARSSQKITVSSIPDGAAVTITNAAGAAVHSGTAPLTVQLKKGRGYFKAEHYLVSVTKEGFQPGQFKIDGAINGWYFGNIIFGGLIGMLAVDPNTGAMYTLAPKKLDAILTPTNKVAFNPADQSLTVSLVEVDAAK